MIIKQHGTIKNYRYVGDVSATSPSSDGEATIDLDVYYATFFL